MTDTTITPEIAGYKPGTWVLDPAHSEVHFSVRHMMISKVRGTFGVKSATLYAPENPLQARVEASVDVTSLDTNDQNRDGHLRSADFFDTENHRYATFRSTRVEDTQDGEFVLHGDLTIRGETRAVALKGEYLGSTASPWGDTRVGFSAEVEVSRKDWGLEWNVALDTGGVLVGDKVKLVIDAEWIAQ